MNNKRRLL